jgi:predicted ATPase
VVLVKGEAGEGKTALLREFARRAQETRPDVVVAAGACNAFWDFGDPYLPFCDVLGMLCGDLEAQWHSGLITPAQAHRVWHLLPATLQNLLEHGPDLPGVFVSGASLLKRAEASLPEDDPALQRLTNMVKGGHPEMGRLGQGQLFEQVSRTLRAISKRAPAFDFAR